MLMYGFGSGGIVKCAGGCGLFMNNSSAPLSKPLSEGLLECLLILVTEEGQNSN